MTHTQARTLAVGTMVYCTVPGWQGWYEVADIRDDDGFLRIRGFSAFLPPTDFRTMTWTISDRKRMH